MSLISGSGWSLGLITAVVHVSSGALRVLCSSDCSSIMFAHQLRTAVTGVSDVASRTNMHLYVVTLKNCLNIVFFNFLRLLLTNYCWLQSEPGYGADVLRLWVSSVDYTGDVLVGPQILRQMSDVYRKLRGTLRYLLSNLHDWKVISVSCCYISLHTS
jgi:hypothetical protein